LLFLVFFFIFIFTICFYPNIFGHPDNYIPANPMVTPAHIVPEWYFLPFYAILRSIPNKLGGVLGMIGSICIFFVLPIFDCCKTRSAKFRPIYNILFWFFITCCILLGWLGQKPVEAPYIFLGQIVTICYFSFFILTPIVSLIEDSDNF